MQCNKVRNIIVSHNGILGDTLIALPALWALRKAFPNARICYLYEKIPNNQFVLANTILDETGLVDEFLPYETYSKKIRRVRSIFSLFLKIYAHKFDLGIILQEAHWPNNKKIFLKLCGIKKVIGPDGKEPRNPRDENGKLLRVPHVADALLAVLQPLNIPIPEKGRGCMKFPLRRKDKIVVDKFLERLGYLNDQRLKVAVAPWSNMPAKRWPLERFSKVVKELISEYNIVPIVFGAPEEKTIGVKLIREWGRGIVAAGKLGIKEGIELLSRCKFYLGNDTGTMHMAACAGIPCVAIFSSRDNPGRWEPYGKGHIVLRKYVPCEGCMLQKCIENKMHCILSITVAEVVEACHQILEKRSSKLYNVYRN